MALTSEEKRHYNSALQTIATAHNRLAGWTKFLLVWNVVLTVLVVIK